MTSLTRARGAFRKTLWMLFGFSLVVNLLMLTMPFYMLQIYERVLPSRSEDTLIFLSIIAVASLAVLGALEAVRGMIASRSAARLEADLGADAMRATVLLAKQTGGDVQPMRDLTNIRGFIGSRGVFSLLDAPFAPLFVGLLWFLHPTLFWLTLTGAGVLIVLAALNQWATSAAAKRAQVAQARAMRAATAMADNDETLRAMGMTDSGISFWGGDNAASLIEQDAVDSRNSILSGLSRTVRMVLQIAILGTGGWLALRNEISPGVIFAASIISGKGLQPIDQIIGAWKQSTIAYSSWQRLSALLERLPEAAKRTQMPQPKGDITLENVRVMPPRGSSSEPILKNLTFTLPAGDVLGIVGPSGSGKSTLARILVGAQSPDGGVVRIDGTDIGNWDPVQLGDQIGYLAQEVRLFPGTVKQNISRLSQLPDDAAVLEAARKAQVHELIQSLPQGYDTIVGPGGYTPSIGQRQRIALARAFYGNPKIMVLDEPNANLDDDGQVALRRALKAAQDNGATVVIITQRKQVLADMKNILRLHAGSVDFHGSNAAFVAAIRQARERSKTSFEEAQRKLRETYGGPQKASQGSAEKTVAPADIEPRKLSMSGGHTGRMGTHPVSARQSIPTKKGA